jgi:coenzyme PQQ precursor peptide PqqA
VGPAVWVARRDQIAPVEAPESTLARVEACTGSRRGLDSLTHNQAWNRRMIWTTPTLEEICIGLEINGYLPAEF